MKKKNRHLDRLSDLGDIPTEVFVDLLKRAKEKATPALVKRFQDINEVCLASHSVCAVDVCRVYLLNSIDRH